MSAMHNTENGRSRVQIFLIPNFEAEPVRHSFSSHLFQAKRNDNA